jgi:hypothetical protein
MGGVSGGERTWLSLLLRPIDWAIYRLCGVSEMALLSHIA